MGKNIKLLPPTTYQGGKQRVAEEIVDKMFDLVPIFEDTKFYDLCCGSGAVSLELISRGVNPKNIVMLDKSSWGTFWDKIGRGEYDIDKLNKYIDDMPDDISKIQSHLKSLSQENPDIDEEYKYILLQAGAFGGKQIWKENGVWNNTSFRSYWLPTETSSRRSPVNPMMPMPNTIKDRVSVLIDKCKGLTCLNIDIWDFFEYIGLRNTNNSVFYIDPPYKNTTQYGFTFDWEEWLSLLFDETLAPIFVSECDNYSDDAVLLNFKGAKGGISGNRKTKNEEWLNIFK